MGKIYQKTTVTRKITKKKVGKSNGTKTRKKKASKYKRT